MKLLYINQFDISKSLRATDAFCARKVVDKNAKSLIYIGAIASDERSQSIF